MIVDRPLGERDVRVVHDLLDVRVGEAVPFLLVLTEADDIRRLPSTESLRAAKDNLLTEVVVVPPVPLDGTSGMLRWVRLLRDVSALGILLRWQLGPTDAAYLRQIVHLTPPTGAIGAGGPVERIVGEWRGTGPTPFYWRLGPAFVLVRDTRAGFEANRWVIDDEETMRAFLRMQSPVATADVGAPQAVRTLVEEGLVLECEGMALTLPNRVERWPIPYTAI
ncbi:MAG: DUF5825 family protein [Frankiaceae bacterium]